MLFFAGLRGAKGWTVLTVAACAVLLLSNAIYFDGGATPRFLLEKGALAHNPWWLAAFYFHIVGASISLAAGTPLMFPQWTLRNPGWHRLLGYVYLNVVLWTAAPSGLALSLTAKGGAWGTAGFALAGVLWWHSTWTGYQAIRHRDIAAHVRAMIRSYAWALSAPAFRIIQLALFLCGIEEGLNYIVSLWLSIAASVSLAESFLHRSRRDSMTLVTSPVDHPGVVL